MRRCPALFIAAPASGQGKTTVTAALARFHRDRGLRVRVFKTGPDFLDPMILERASGNPVYQLDLWMGGEDHCRRLLYDAAGETDLILVEGVMGLFDGEPCGADLAVLFGIPVLAAIDGAAMAQTFGAVAHGLATYRAELTFFSPLDDSALPETDAVYLPGGYPELHLHRLAANQSMKEAIRAHHGAGKPIVAECGGMLYLLDLLADAEGRSASMAGLLPGKAVMQPRLANLGLHRAPLPEGELRGHTFHHSRMECGLEPVTCSGSARHHGTPEPIYRRERLTASYLHFYFPSNPEASARLFLP